MSEQEIVDEQNIITPEQQVLLDMMKAQNQPYLNELSEGEIAEGIKSLSRSMFETLLTDMAIKIKEEGENFNFEIKVSNHIREVVQMSTQLFMKLMYHYDLQNRQIVNEENIIDENGVVTL